MPGNHATPVACAGDHSGQVFDLVIKSLGTNGIASTQTGAVIGNYPSLRSHGRQDSRPGERSWLPKPGNHDNRSVTLADLYPSKPPAIAAQLAATYSQRNKLTQRAKNRINHETS